MAAVGNNDYGQCDVSGWTDIVAVDTGGLHTVGVRSDGSVAATGLNGDGQCDVSGWADIVAVAAGDYHTVGLKSDGSVVAVGATSGFNAQGQLNVPGWTDIVAISAGRLHSVGLKSDGTVVAVGNNDGGRCDVAEWTDIVAISAGEYGTVGLRDDGTVVAVGYNGSGQFDVSGWSEIVAISAGANHTLGLKADGTVISAGDNSHGQRNLSAWDRVTAVEAGGTNSIALRSDGEVVAQGNNDYGQLGISPGADFTGVAAGDGHSVGLRSDGTVVAIGASSYDKTDVAGWSDVVAIEAGLQATLGIKRDGAVVMVGDNNFGWADVTGWTDIVAVSANEFGAVVGVKRDGTAVCTALNTDEADEIATWDGLVDVARGYSHTVGLRADGTVVASGDNNYGQGDVGSWTGIIAVDAGESHTVGLKSDGTVVATGLNGHGECDVSGWTGIVSIAANKLHTVGLKANGTAVAVGCPYVGHLAVGGWSDLVAIAAGYRHTLGLKADGSVVAVGLGSSGELNTAGWTSAVNTLPRSGTLGGEDEVGLRAQAGSGFSRWIALSTDTRPLAPGESVKIAVRVSDDGITWSEPLGRTGLPIDWTDGTGTYLGSACGDFRWYTDLTRIPAKRFIDLEVRLESEGVSSPEVRAIEAIYDSNSAPVAVDDPFSTAEDVALTVPGPGVLENDTEPDDDTLSVVAFSTPTNGALSATSTAGAFTYTPPKDWSGTASFTYTVSDGILTDTGTVTIEVDPANDAPVATADSYSTPYGTVLAVAAPGVLKNDTDVENDALGAWKVTDPAHGTLSLSTDGSFTYTPSAGYSGPDSFTYRASDGKVDSAPVTVAITVGTAPNVAQVTTTLSLTSSSATPKYGTSVTLSATLLGDGAALDGRTVIFERLSGTSWVTVGSSSTAGGIARFSVTPYGGAKTTYRARFTATTTHAASTSVTAVVTPKVYLTKGNAPKVMYQGRARTVTGYLKPRHPKGSRKVQVRLYKRNSKGVYVYKSRVSATLANYGSYSKWTRSVSFPSKGKWAIQAYMPADSQHAATTSAFDYVTVVSEIFCK